MNDKYALIQNTIQMLNNVQTSGVQSMQTLISSIQNLVDLYNGLQAEDAKKAKTTEEMTEETPKDI